MARGLSLQDSGCLRGSEQHRLASVAIPKAGAASSKRNGNDLELTSLRSAVGISPGSSAERSHSLGPALRRPTEPLLCLSVLNCKAGMIKVLTHCAVARLRRDDRYENTRPSG